MEKLPQDREAPSRQIVHLQKAIRIHIAPRSLAGKIVTVVLAVSIIVLVFFFFAAGIALLGLVVAIAIGRVLWLSMKRQSR